MSFCLEVQDKQKSWDRTKASLFVCPVKWASYLSTLHLLSHLLEFKKWLFFGSFVVFYSIIDSCTANRSNTERACVPSLSFPDSILHNSIAVAQWRNLFSISVFVIQNVMEVEPQLGSWEWRVSLTIIVWDQAKLWYKAHSFLCPSLTLRHERAI